MNPQEQPQLAEPEKKKIIVDETLFVELHRNKNPLHDRLELFLSQSKKGDSKRKYHLIMPRLCRLRLGLYWLYGNICERKIKKNKQPRTKQAMMKRSARADTALTVVSGYIRRGFWLSLRRSKLMDVFMCVNDHKARDIEQREGRKMAPSEVIPMEICKIAQIAHSNNIPVLSFNRDYSYFQQIPLSSSSYIRYIDPDNFLKYDVKE